MEILSDRTGRPCWWPRKPIKRNKTMAAAAKTFLFSAVHERRAIKGGRTQRESRSDFSQDAGEFSGGFHNIQLWMKKGR